MSVESSTVQEKEGELCSICLTALIQSNKDLYTTKCNHQFHFACLVQTAAASHTECPLCRTRLDSFVQTVQPATRQNLPVPSPRPQPTTSSTSGRTLWSNLRGTISSAVNWLGRTSRLSVTAAQARTDDDVSEEEIREIAARIAARRQENVNQQANFEIITVIPTLEFQAQVFDRQSNMFGMIQLKASAQMPCDLTDKEFTELRIPADIVCVVDKSGSMSGNKLALLKETLIYLIDQLNSRDRLAIISFDTDAYNHSNGLIRMTESNKQNIKRILTDDIRADGGTYIGSGLMMANTLLQDRRTRNPVGTLLLLTDGQDNKFHDYTNIMRRLPPEVVCHTFGYGLGHRADLLSQLAEQGNNGTFTYIDEFPSISLAFATALGSVFTCVAQHLKVNLEFDHPYTIIQAHSTYPHMPLALPSPKLTFKLHDLNAEEVRHLLFEIVVPKIAEPVDENHIIGHVSLQYTNPINNANVETESSPFLLRRPGQLAANSPLLQANFALDVQRNRVKTSSVLKQAVVEQNDEKVKAMLQAQIASIRASISAEDPLCQKLIKDLTQQYSNREQFATAMTNMCMQHGQERATYSTGFTVSAASYMTSGQERYRSIARRS